MKPRAQLLNQEEKKIVDPPDIVIIAPNEGQIVSSGSDKISEDSAEKWSVSDDRKTIGSKYVSRNKFCTRPFIKRIFIN